MNNEQTQEAAMLQGLISAMGTDCPECGEANATGAEVCEFCGAELEVDIEDDEPALSIMQAVGIGEMTGYEVDEALRKIPMSKATNLILLKDSVEKILAKQITIDEYRKNVSRVLNVARNGVELFKSDIVKKKVAEFDENLQSIVWDSAALYEDFLAGCQRMMEYDGGANPAAANDGLKKVETALRNMDSLHDDVIQTSREIKAEPEE